MTGTAVDGHRCGPPGRLGLAWLLDTVAQRASAPMARVDHWVDESGVTCEDPDGREDLFASWVYRPRGMVHRGAELGS